MSLLFFDGFENYNDTAEMAKKWTYAISMNFDASSRNGQGVLYQANDHAYTTFPDTQTIVYGHAYKTSSVATTYPISALWDNFTTRQVVVGQMTGGGLGFYRGTTLLEQTGSGLISAGTWYYIELKVTVDNSSGSYEVRLNGDVILSDTGVDTQQTANASVDAFGWNSFPDFAWRYIDDLYILDTTGSDNNDFLGDVRVETIYPDGAGNETDWTPSTGSNWENVDDAQPDDDSTYNYVASGGGLPANDLYTLGSLVTGVGEIYGIQINSYTRKDDAGSVKLANILRTGGTTYSGMGVESISDSYNFQLDIVEQNPNTSSAWTIAEVNSLETGIRRVS